MDDQVDTNNVVYVEKRKRVRNVKINNGPKMHRKPKAAAMAEAKLKCPDCGKWFTPKSMYNHSKTHTPKIPCPFPECPHTYTRTDNLRKHILKQHQQDVSLTPKQWALNMKDMLPFLEAQISVLWPVLNEPSIVLPSLAAKIPQNQNEMVVPVVKRQTAKRVTTQFAAGNFMDVVEPMLQLPYPARVVISNFFERMAQALLQDNQQNPMSPPPPLTTKPSPTATVTVDPAVAPAAQTAKQPKSSAQAASDNMATESRPTTPTLNADALNTHMCPMCQMSFPSKRELRFHTFRQHETSAKKHTTEICLY